MQSSKKRTKRITKEQTKQHGNESLTQEERLQLRQQVDWLDQMEAYLIDEEHLSRQNYRSVMRQVEKLVQGTGVTYSHWDESTYFCEGSRVTLCDDFDALYKEACDFEDEHGKDRGNGTCRAARRTPYNLCSWNPNAGAYSLFSCSLVSQPSYKPSFTNNFY